MNRVIYIFWTGENEMSENRLKSIQQLKDVSGVELALVTPSNLSSYILKSAPLHESYTYLSETHKADYLRTCFMNFHGGGYSDIKKTTGSWIKAFDDIGDGEVECEACDGDGTRTCGDCDGDGNVECYECH